MSSCVCYTLGASLGPLICSQALTTNVAVCFYGNKGGRHYLHLSQQDTAVKMQLAIMSREGGDCTAECYVGKQNQQRCWATFLMQSYNLLKNEGEPQTRDRSTSVDLSMALVLVS